MRPCCAEVPMEQSRTALIRIVDLKFTRDTDVRVANAARCAKRNASTGGHREAPWRRWSLLQSTSLINKMAILTSVPLTKKLSFDMSRMNSFRFRWVRQIFSPFHALIPVTSEIVVQFCRNRQAAQDSTRIANNWQNVIKIILT